MKRDPVGMDELVEYWTVLRGECDPVDTKYGATRLGFALSLKLHTRHGQFPQTEVLRLVAVGRSNWQIAGELCTTTKTAGVHISNIRTKVGRDLPYRGRRVRSPPPSARLNRASAGPAACLSSFSSPARSRRLGKGG